MHGHPDTLRCRHVHDGDDVRGRGRGRGLDDVRDRGVMLMIMLMHILQPVAFAAPGTPEHPESGANNDHCGNQLEPRFC